MLPPADAPEALQSASPAAFRIQDRKASFSSGLFRTGKRRWISEKNVIQIPISPINSAAHEDKT